MVLRENPGRGRPDRTHAPSTQEVEPPGQPKTNPCPQEGANTGTRAATGRPGRCPTITTPLEGPFLHRAAPARPRGRGRSRGAYPRDLYPLSTRTTDRRPTRESPQPTAGWRRSSLRHPTGIPWPEGRPPPPSRLPLRWLRRPGTQAAGGPLGGEGPRRMVPRPPGQNPPPASPTRPGLQRMATKPPPRPGLPMPVAEGVGELDSCSALHPHRDPTRSRRRPMIWSHPNPGRL